MRRCCQPEQFLSIALIWSTAIKTLVCQGWSSLEDWRGRIGCLIRLIQSRNQSMFQQVSSQEKGEYPNCWSRLIGLRAERIRGRPEPAFMKSQPGGGGAWGGGGVGGGGRVWGGGGGVWGGGGIWGWGWNCPQALMIISFLSTNI